MISLGTFHLSSLSLACWRLSLSCFFFRRTVFLRIVVVVKPRQQGATVIMLNGALKEQFTITAAKCALEF
jgi:hypothetical protein